ncbi:hypothetical protein [Dechloromonas sp. ZS-1]|uniref:hypothetical protein n=1 Tax=Dechloromonas sp. ZS-1 TaxID=3138067 RepID=UPI0031FCD96D
MASLNEHSPYVAWLGCLNAIGHKIRREGLMAIEADVERPMNEDSPFSKFPLTLKQPYLEFACDILRLMLGGMLNQPALIDLYAENALRANRSGRFWQRADEKLLRLIAVTLRMLSDEHHPNVACEFGRQVIPALKRPAFNEVEEWLREQRVDARMPLSEERISAFLSGIGVSAACKELQPSASINSNKYE